MVEYTDRQSTEEGFRKALNPYVGAMEFGDTDFMMSRTDLAGRKSSDIATTVSGHFQGLGYEIKELNAPKTSGQASLRVRNRGAAITLIATDFRDGEVRVSTNYLPTKSRLAG